MSKKQVTATSLNVRASPQVQSDNRVGLLSNGEMIEVISSSGGWAEFDHTAGNAFCSENYLQAVEPEKESDEPAQTKSKNEPKKEPVIVDDKDEGGWLDSVVNAAANVAEDLVDWWTGDDKEVADKTAKDGTEWWDDVVDWWKGKDDPHVAGPEQELDKDVGEIVKEAGPAEDQTPAEEPAGGGYFSHPDAGSVAVSYGPNAVPLNATAEHLYRSILASVGLSSGYISSTLRTYADQARINYEQSSPSQILQWYGQDVYDTYTRYKEEGKTTEDYAIYLEERDQSRGGLISRHISNLCLDHAPHNGAYAAKLAELVPVAGSGVSSYLSESGCTHTQFSFNVT